MTEPGQANDLADPQAGIADQVEALAFLAMLAGKGGPTDQVAGPQLCSP